jgi:hypothetical protein
LDNPCNLIDPLGLQACNFNITIVQNGLLTPQQASDAQLRIRSLLSQAGVGVLFNQTSPDFTITPDTQYPPGDFGRTPSTFLGGMNGPYSPGSEGYVNTTVTTAEVGAQNLGFAVGTITAHELGHFLFGSWMPGTGSGLWMEGGWDKSFLLDKRLRIPNPGAVRSKCNQLHPSTSSPSGAGGGYDLYALLWDPFDLFGGGDDEDGEQVTSTIVGWEPLGSASSTITGVSPCPGDDPSGCLC